MADDPNPNPARITDASWRFMTALLEMEPDTESAGIYANKPGYHNTRNANSANDYSRRHPLDLLGPGDKAAAYDWTHRAAQRGDYRSMAKYGARLKAAHAARDPRLYGWREAQGQTDTDRAPEELNFGADGWTTGVPASSHEWHWHLSEHRAFVASWENKLAMLSILIGETLASYRARGGKLMGDNGDTTGGLMFCNFGDKGPAVKAMQLQLMQVRPDLMTVADGDYGNKTAAAVSIELTGGYGRVYGPEEFALLQQKVAAKTSGARGDQGPAGPQGPKGDPGAAAVLAPGTELRVIVAP